MGDRGNIAILGTGPAPVYLYTHWNGEGLPGIVAGVLKRKQRWEDAQYLARMLFSAMVPADERDGETGFGISTEIGDNGHPIIVVDCNEQKVRIVTEAAARKRMWKRATGVIPFAEVTVEKLTQAFTDG